MEHAELWPARAKRTLRAELKRRSVTQAALAVRLRTVGVTIAPQSVYNRISRGTFSAAFLVQCLPAIGAERIELDRSDVGGDRSDAAPCTIGELILYWKFYCKLLFLRHG